MHGRIADPWGSRTPHPRGTSWPSRVDENLAEGIDAADVDRWVQTACERHEQIALTHLEEVRGVAIRRGEALEQRVA